MLSWFELKKESERTARVRRTPANYEGIRKDELMKFREEREMVEKTIRMEKKEKERKTK